MGCYRDDPDDRDMTLQWDVGANRSPHECILACQDLQMSFAGLQEGGACYCGDSFGKHGEEEEEECNMKCQAGFKRMNCGGVTSNAIYRTERGKSSNDAGVFKFTC